MLSIAPLLRATTESCSGSEVHCDALCATFDSVLVAAVYHDELKPNGRLVSAFRVHLKNLSNIPFLKVLFIF